MGNYYCGSGHSRSQECIHCVSIRSKAEKAAEQLIIDREQERIIKLLEDYDFSTIWRQVAWSPDAWESFGSDDLIALIKEEK